MVYEGNRLGGNLRGDAGSVRDFSFAARSGLDEMELRWLRLCVLDQGLGVDERSVLRTAAPPQTPSAITASSQKTKLATKAPQKAKNPTPKAFVTRTGIGAGFM